VVASGELPQGSSEGRQEADQLDAVEQARRWLAEHGVAVPEGPDSPGHLGRGPSSSPPAAQRGRRSATDPLPSAPREELQSEVGAGGGPRLFAEGDADPVSVARAIVLRKLAAQSRTRVELERALKRKQVPDDAARTVLDRMESVGLIDDETFARDWVESRQQRRHLSKSALRRELTAKGVERSEIDTALDVVDSEDELTAARALATKKARPTVGLDAQVRYRRLAGVLARRGFSPHVVSRVLAETLSDRDPSD
jgi:regulatory protein